MAAAIPLYPDLRRVHPELRRAPIFSRLDSHSYNSHAVSRSANCTKLNRQTLELERLVTPRKQTPALRSNRQNFHFCFDEISTPLSSVGAQHAVPATDAWLTCSDGKDGRGDRFSQFLPGSGLRAECDVTHSKQSIASFLPGATTACRLSFPGWNIQRAYACKTPQAVARSMQFVHRLSEKWTALNHSFRAGSSARAFACALSRVPMNVDFEPFLTGSAPQTEFAVTHSKQTTETFLTGARTAFKRTDNEFPRSPHRPFRPAPRNTGRGPRRTTSNRAASRPLPSPTSHAYVRLIANSMPARGKFIVLEGIDGSGKRTQLDMLARAFASRNVPFAQISFPHYDGFFGKLAARYLNGEFGSLEVVDPHFSALLYAGDRFEAKPKIESDLASGQTLLADRYIGSNLAHQGARVPRDKRPEFLQWLRQLEYQVYALPAEDLVIYLRVPPAEAHRLIGEKGARTYTKLQRDIQESNLAHLEATSEVYDQLARQPNWLKIECYDLAAKALRSPESIHQEILAAVQAHVTPTLRANK
jgi:dTMP kinase